MNRLPVGTYLTHRFNPELGVGRVTAHDGRAIVVEFPLPGTTLRLAAGADALVPVDLSPGRPVRVTATREESTIEAHLPDGTFRLKSGTVVSPGAVWPVELHGSLVERLALGELDDVQDFLTRLDILHLLSLREADGLGSFLGGRVRLFPHQLHVAERASRANPVRWLLADEVGLGKTIEAALILNRLVHRGGVDRCLIVAPEPLTVQWLGELWRKYHHVFTLLDGPRLADVERDFGADFNPFDVHRRTVVALETLIERPELTTQAVKAGIDLLVVDEAQHLRRPPGHPGDPAWRAVAPIAALGRHVLLLSATPLEDDAHGFFRLLQLLRPEEFPEDASFDDRLATGTPLPPCTSSTRRVDIGGLPPRVGLPITFDETRAAPHLTTERLLRAAPAKDPVARRKKLDRMRRAAASGAALSALLDSKETKLRELAQAMDAGDPRVEWLASHGPRWKQAFEKTLVFVAHRETLEMLRTALSHRAQLATGVFHEDLSSVRRDTEVARFREADGPSILISTECGGEGRNFEFCTRLVLFDLPWKPSVVEQRIGRLDRIGRRIPVQVVYFRMAGSVGYEAARLFEDLGLFKEPMAGLEPQLGPVERALDDVAVTPEATLAADVRTALLGAAHAARTRIHEAAYHELHRDPYRADMGAGILARVPSTLDALNEHVVTRVCSRLGFKVERLRDDRVYAIELGSESLVDGLPGVAGGTGFVGTFDREEAVQDETIDYFASGHRLVEGVFAHFEDNTLGRVTRFAIEVPDERGEGLVAIYKDGPLFDVVALDAHARPRPAWAAPFRAARPLRVRRIVDTRGDGRHWRALARDLGGHLDRARRPYALISIVVRPPA